MALLVYKIVIFSLGSKHLPIFHQCLYCRDGSDEPGTPACPNGKFHCMNKGHRSLNLVSSRVNDKICDCCDGSDEWGTDASCPNVCVEMGKKAQEEQKQRQELHALGHSKRKDYAAQGKQKERDTRAELAEKEAEAEILRGEVEQLATAKDAAEEPENLAKDEHRIKWEAEKEAKKEATSRDGAQLDFDELDVNSDGSVSVEELQTRYELDDDEDGDVSEEEAMDYLNNVRSVNFEEFYPAVWFKVADKCQFHHPSPSQSPKEVKENVPGEENYINDNNNEADNSLNDDEDGYDDEEDDYDDEDDDYDEDDEDDENDIPFPNRDAKEMPEYDDDTKKLIEAAETARSAHRDAEMKKINIEREVADLKNRLEIDYGPEHEFSIMYDQCYEFTDREYTYKMCAFKKVTQRPKSGGRETTLGTWGKWNGPPNNLHSVMVYEDGEKCWNGPSRSATITIVCGLEDQLLSASEPNRCEYALDFSTPAVCSPIVHSVHEEL